jgi:O2-independent ubiquinone biosynthesis accessory factor UbiT
MLGPAHDPLTRLPVLWGLVLRPLPLLPLQLALQSVVRFIAMRQPALRDRLQSIAGSRIGIDPSDLPFSIVLEPHTSTIALTVVRNLRPETAAARIRGPFLALLGLIDGTYDGDALFFSRDIIIEGDVEAVLALRNAIDDAEINLADETVACVGSLSFTASRVVRYALASCAEILIRPQTVR